MKKRITVISLLVILVALLAMGTAAYTYYQHEDRATNIITTNKIEMTLDEQLTSEAWEEQKNVFILKQEVMPTQTIDKAPTIRNVGAEPFYTRVKVEIVVTAPDGSTLPSKYIQPLFNDNDNNWVYADGWYYYNGALNPADESPVFSGVMVTADTPNEYKNATVSIVVTSQAVQVKNNPIPEEGITAVRGWPTLDSGGEWS